MPRGLNRLVAMMVGVLLLLPGGAQGADMQHFTMAGFDGDDSSHDWNTNAFFSRMEKRTGITFDFDQYNDYEKWQQAKEEMFATGSLPDVLFKAELTTEELCRYTDSGQLVDLKPLLQKNAPNLWALLTENPDWLEAITLPNGAIGALPTIFTLSPQNAMWINQKWLDNLGLSLPTDAESLQKVLQAFYEGDPNQNGKRDEVPLSFLGPWDLKFLGHAFGLVANDYNLYVDESGRVQYMPAQEEYIAFLKYLRTLYQNKLLDQNGFYMVEMLRTPTEEKPTVIYGMFFGPNPLSIYTYEESKEYTLLPPLSYGGEQKYRDLYGEISRGTFAITSACKNPEALLTWVDVLYTQEGAIEAMAGEENTDYSVDENGFWQWVRGTESQSSSWLADFTIYDTGNLPWCFPEAFFIRYAQEEVRQITMYQLELRNYLIKPFPYYSLTPQQEEEVVTLQNELGLYVDECLARFVLGQWPLTDERIAAFRQGLEQRGMERLLLFWQNIYDRIEQPVSK